jgi:superfamily II DNA or RNA helicase
VADWPWQPRSCDLVLAAIARGQRRVVLTLPTGMGKTRVASMLVERWLADGLDSILFTNRRLLIDQLSDMMNKAGIPHGLRAAGHHPEHHHPFQIASLPTEHSRVVKAKTWETTPAKRVLVDEAHLHTNTMAQRIVGLYLDQGASVVYLTATPIGMGDVADELIQPSSLAEGREHGALVLARHFGPDEPDLKQIGSVTWNDDSDKTKSRRLVGSVDEHGEPDVKLVKLYGRVYANWKTLNPDGKPTILFAPGVKESVWFAQQFAKRGVRAAHIDGEDVWVDGEFFRSNRATREEVLSEFRQRRIALISNRFVLREGVDIPEVEHIINATVFGSLQSCLQANGRGLRASPKTGKTVCVIQDHGGCLDTETEILTKRGWLGIDEITDDDVIGTMNVSDSAPAGKFEWQRNEGTIRKQRDGSMKQVMCSHIDLRVTDYHEMVMRPDLRHGDWKKVKAGELTKRESNWIIPVSTYEHAYGADLTDYELGFIGWFLTDGCLDGARVRIYQAVGAPEKHHRHIVTCLEGCGFRYTIKTRKRPSPFGGESSGEVTYSVSSGRKSVGGWYKLSPYIDKSFPLESFDNLDVRQFGVLLEAMNLGDGLKHTTYDQKTISLAIGRKEVADRIQSLAVRRGYRCNLATEDTRTGNKIYILHLRQTDSATIAKGAFTDSYISHDERVWCVQTAAGTIVTRRHGKVAIMGNSWWRHGSLNAERTWNLAYGSNTLAGLREDRMREKVDAEPFRCPQCAMILATRRCLNCGYVVPVGVKSRPVVTSEGELKEQQGDIFPPRRRLKKDDTVYLWTTIWCRMFQANKTYRQAETLFALEHWYYPPRDLALMPREPADWFRRIPAVPNEQLIGPVSEKMAGWRAKKENKQPATLRVEGEEEPDGDLF